MKRIFLNTVTTIFTVFAIFIASSCTKNTNLQHDTLPVGYVFPQKDTLSVLTWNVEHFVDDYDNPYIANKMEDNPKDVAKRIDILANMLRQINADVVVFEEFESRSLAMKIAKEKLSDLGYRFFGANESPDWYMNVVIMSKLPLGITYGYGNVYGNIENFKDSLGRQETQNNVNTRMLTTEIRAKNDFKFYLTGLHLKAGRNKKDTAVRAGQMKVLQTQANRFLQLDKNANMLIVGDFNATPESWELKLLLNSDKNNPKNVQFIDALANTNMFSHPSEKPSWRIDHMLMNKNMAKYLIPNGVKVAENLDKEKLKEVSDHLPMVAKFLLK